MPRANRFPLTLPVRYRVRGDKGWSYGITRNISSSGLLFQSGRTVSRDAAMDIEVVLPGDEDATVRVVSRGAVKRIASSAKSDQLIAATLDASELVRTARTS